MTSLATKITPVRDTTKLLPGGFYFTNERNARGRNVYRAEDGRLFTFYAGERNYIETGENR